MKTLCEYWLDYFPEFYKSFFALIGVMLGMNVFLTYIFRVVFHPKIFKTKHRSSRYILTAVCVFTFQFVFFGFVPEYVMDSDIWDLSRDWYLKAGTIYTLYFL